MANDPEDTAIGLVGSRTNLDRCYIRTRKTISILQGRFDDSGQAGMFERELWSEPNYSDIVDGSSHIEQNRLLWLLRVCLYTRNNYLILHHLYKLYTHHYK